MIVRCIRCSRRHEPAATSATAATNVVRAVCPGCGKETLALIESELDEAPAGKPTVTEDLATIARQIFREELVDQGEPEGEVEDRDDHIETEYRAWLRTDDGAAMARLVRELALEIRARGFGRYGIAALFEVARWKRDLAIGPDEAGYRANNNYRSRLARDLMRKYPNELGDLFETRELRARKEGG